MPTQIPTKTCESLDAVPGRIGAYEPRSFLAEAKEILLLSLLAAAIVYTVAFAIIWAYT